MHHAQGTGQTSNIEKEQRVWKEKKIYQAWSKCYGSKISQKIWNRKKSNCTDELHVFKKMSVSDSD